MRIASSSYSVNPVSVISISTHFCNLGKFAAGMRPQRSATTDMSTVIFCVHVAVHFWSHRLIATPLTLLGRQN